MDGSVRGVCVIDHDGLASIGATVETFGNVTLIMGDCTKVLPFITSVAAIVTDPPYGIGLDYSSQDFSDSEGELRVLVDSFMPEFLRIAPLVSITPGNVNHYLYPKPTWTLCWFNRAGAGSGPWGFSCWQPILCYGGDPYLRNGKGRRPDFIEWSETSEKNGHPCPKPVRFQKKWIERVAFDADVILDPFMGSGTTGVAAVQMGKSFVGIEREQAFFDIAKARIIEAQRQPDMFFDMFAG